MVKQATLFLFLLALLLAGCGTGPAGTAPLQQLVQAEDQSLQQAEAALDAAISAFSDVLPASTRVQATSEPRPITSFCCIDVDSDGLMIGGPWRPPFPWPVPNGPRDLVDKPLFVVIKTKSSPRHTAYMGYLRQGRNGYEVEWYGARGAATVRTPATATDRAPTPEEIARRIKVTLFSKKTTTYPDGTQTTEVDILRIDYEGRVVHIVAPLPDGLEGRVIEASLTALPQLSNTLRDICCGRPKPFPASWPPSWLLRNDFSLALIPYDNPRLREARTIEELIGQNLGMVYLRKKPVLPGTTTDCGPNRVWCPPDQDPLYNLRLVEGEQGLALQLTKLGDPGQVIATLPASVSLDENTGPGIDIEDRIGPDNLEIKITVAFEKMKFTVTVEVKP
ncbi:MAG: hypothetical protein KatS3mg071_2708 [Meiothermus sp.]|nr:MAG: hypothetical protein KatS3mg071_2708 [Meiothermus sp.]